MWFEQLTFGQLVDRAAEQWGDREALCFAGRRWSFTQFREETDRAAKGLIAAGVEPGDHVCLWLANRPEYLFIFFAIARIGAVIVPINTRASERDPPRLNHVSTAAERAIQTISPTSQHGIHYRGRWRTRT